MSSQSLTTVRKPPVSYDRRLKSRRFRTLNLSHVRRIALQHGLDTSRLKHKWEVIHVLVEHRKPGPKAYIEHVSDKSRRTFFIFPPEIRNIIYGYILIDPDYIHSRDVRYEGPSKEFSMRAAQYANRLKSLSWTNHALRIEARSFFFANNRFKLVSYRGASLTHFLDMIGDQGRASLATVSIDNYFTPLSSDVFALSPFRHSTGLRNLELLLKIDDIFKPDDLMALEAYMMGRTNGLGTTYASLMLRKCFRDFIAYPALQTLSIHYVLPRSFQISRYIGRPGGCAFVTAWMKANLPSKIRDECKSRNVVVTTHEIEHGGYSLV